MVWHHTFVGINTVGLVNDGRLGIPFTHTGTIGRILGCNINLFGSINDDMNSGSE